MKYKCGHKIEEYQKTYNLFTDMIEHMEWEQYLGEHPKEKCPECYHEMKIKR